MATKQCSKCGGIYETYCKPCKSAYDKEYINRNRERINENHKHWRHENVELSRQYSLKSYYLHHDQRLQERKRWKRDNPEKWRIAKKNRRHRERAAEGRYSYSDIQGIFRSQLGLCWWCGRALPTDYHIDHRIPLSRGGSNWPANLVLSCERCNKSKGAKLPYEWNGRLL